MPFLAPFATSQPFSLLFHRRDQPSEEEGQGDDYRKHFKIRRFRFPPNMKTNHILDDGKCDIKNAGFEENPKHGTADTETILLSETLFIICCYLYRKLYLKGSQGKAVKSVDVSTITYKTGWTTGKGSEIGENGVGKAGTNRPLFRVGLFFMGSYPCLTF